MSPLNVASMKNNNYFMKKTTTKKEPEMDERLKQLLMLRKEDMTMG